MTEQERKQAIELLEEAENLLKTEAFMECSVAERCEECVTKALALLKPCQTCGGSRKKQKYIDKGYGYKIDIPCSACQEPAKVIKEIVDCFRGPKENNWPDKETQNPDQEPDHPYPESQGLVEERRPERLLRDLLAVIHKDGGQHNADVGLYQSTQDARTLINQTPADHIAESVEKVGSEFMAMIESLVGNLPNKPSPGETKKFLISLIDILFDSIDQLKAAEKWKILYTLCNTERLQYLARTEAAEIDYKAAKVELGNYEAVVNGMEANLEAAEAENKEYWEDLLRKLQDVWPDKKLIYGLSPLELITELAVERDELEDKLKEQGRESEKRRIALNIATTYIGENDSSALAVQGDIEQALKGE